MKPLPLFAATLLAGCAGTSPRVVEPAEYLAGFSSDPSVYREPPASSFVAPFDIAFWVRSYRWKAQFSPGADGTVQLDAKWIRTNG